MGNSNHTIKFKKSDDKKLLVKTLCKINKDNKIQIVDNELLAFLLNNQTKKIKIVSIVGDVGHGKSTIIELLASKFLKKNLRLFENKFSLNSVTKGIQYLTCDLDKDTVLLFIDSEGFESNNNKEYENELYLLVAQIARISTITLHITTDIRIKNSFSRFLETVDIEKRYETDQNYLKKKNLQNLIEILNKQESLDCTKSNEFPIFYKSFYLPTFKNISEDKICVDERFMQNLDNIAQEIKTLEFESIHKNTEKFKENQTCKSFYEILITSLDILTNRGMQDKKQFADVINLQLGIKTFIENEVKDKYQEFISELEKEIKPLAVTFKSQFISFQAILTIYTVKSLFKSKQFEEYLKILNQKWQNQLKEGLTIIFSLDNQNKASKKVLEDYSKMNGIKPREIQIYENNLKIQNVSKALQLGGSFIQIAGLITSLVAPEVAVGSVGISALTGLGVATSWTIIGLVVFGGLASILGLVLAIKESSTQVKKKNWKRNLKQKLVNKLYQLNLKVQNDQDLEQNYNILKDNIQSLLKQTDILEKQNKETTNFFIPFFYFNIMSKQISQDLLKRSKKNNNLQRVLIEIDREIVEKYDLQKQKISKIIKEVLLMKIKKELKTELRNDSNQFNYFSYKFNQDKYQKLVDQIQENSWIEQDQKQTFEKFISCLIFIKLFSSAILNQVLYQMITPVTFYEEQTLELFIHNLKQYFKFQQELLDAEFER